MMGSLKPPSHLLFIVAIVSSALLTQPSRSQPANDTGCNGVLLSYSVDSSDRIRPFLADPKAQPYKFSATASVLNSGLSPLLSWTLLVSFANREIIVSADGASIASDSDLPFNTSTAGGPTSFSGSPAVLKTAIATAGDLTQIQAQIPIVGTLFGSPPLAVTSLSLDDPSFLCPKPSTSLASNTTLQSCCVKDPKFKANSTEPDDPLAGAGNGTLTPLRSGDLTISYDVLQAYSGSYLALVTIDNHNTLGRLDNWRLSWDWARGEFITTMRGAYTSVSGASECIYGTQGQYYQDMDFSKVENCERRPTILDLPVSMTNDTNSGLIPFCCRNGTILPPEMDPSQSKSAFQLQVTKMPPDLNRTKIFPPENWKISGAPGFLNPEYRCGAPARVPSSEFPDSSGLQSTTLAIATWQVVCNIAARTTSAPKCCVSFSAYYNESVVPCKTCACGCPAKTAGPACNATAPALLLPSQALLVPFDNRTVYTDEWARQKHFQIPKTRPCGDFCGVSINWHVNSDYRKGWTARVTLFNWGDVNFADWFAAAELGKAYDGYEKMYSFNGSAMGNNTIFMQGIPGLNYLVAEANSTNPDKDPRIPGKQQSVVSFTKKNTPGINLAKGDGFPTKVFFNGEECSMPDIIPSGGLRRSVSGSLVASLIVFVVVVLRVFEL